MARFSYGLRRGGVELGPQLARRRCSGQSADLFLDPFSAHADGERRGARSDRRLGIGNVSVGRTSRSARVLGVRRRRAPRSWSKKTRSASRAAFEASSFVSSSSAEAFFYQYLGACRRRTPRNCADLKAPKDASHSDLSDAALRSDLGLGVHRRHAPKRC